MINKQFLRPTYHESVSVSAIGQLGWPGGTPRASYGAELTYHWSSGPADQTHTLWRRIEWGGAVALTSVALPAVPDQSATRAGQLNAFLAPNLTTLPLLNAVLQPRVGAGFLLARPQRWGWAFGADFIWNAARDLDHARFPGRIALGYEFDHASLPARNSVVVKFGFDSWHTRVPVVPQLRPTGRHFWQRQQSQQQKQQRLAQ